MLPGTQIHSRAESRDHTRLQFQGSEKWLGSKLIQDRKLNKAAMIWFIFLFRFMNSPDMEDCKTKEGVLVSQARKSKRWSYSSWRCEPTWKPLTPPSLTRSNLWQPLITSLPIIKWPQNRFLKIVSTESGIQMKRKERTLFCCRNGKLKWYVRTFPQPLATRRMEQWKRLPPFPRAQCHWEMDPWPADLTFLGGERGIIDGDSEMLS